MCDFIIENDHGKNNIIKQVLVGKLKRSESNSSNIILKRYSDNLPVNIHFYNNSEASDIENDLKFSKFLGPLIGSYGSNKTRPL